MTTRPVPPITANTVYLTSLQVRERLGGRSRAWLPRMVAAGRFPAPYRLGDGWFKYWKLEDIERWESEQKPTAEIRPRKRREVTERAA